MNRYIQIVVSRYINITILTIYLTFISYLLSNNKKKKPNFIVNRVLLLFYN